MRKEVTLKKILGPSLLILFLITTILLIKTPAQAKTIKLKGKYYQSDARKMLPMINSFRTGKEAWYYKKGSKKKVKLKNLKKLKYDYKLEKVAMQRAAELVASFSHTRPNRKQWYTAYPSGFRIRGENIAMGDSILMSTSFTMDLWKETYESYRGQGHRRNMLSKNYTCVGIACFEYGNMKFWVQEFGNPRLGSKKTAACNKTKKVKITIK